MRFGNQSIVVQVVTENLAVRDSHGNPELARTPTKVSGCRVRPLEVREDTTNNADRVTETLRVTSPVVPAVVNLSPNDEIDYEGDTYQVSLARVFSDLAG